MKIALVTTIYPPDIGGPASYAWDVSRRLRRRGHAVTIVAASTTSSVDEHVLRPPNVLHRIRFVRGLVRVGFLFWFLLRAGRSADVLFVQSPGHVGLLTLFVARILRKPVVLRYPGDVAWERTFVRGGTVKTLYEFLRAPEGGWTTRLLMRIQRFTIRRVDEVVTPSEYIRHSLIDAYGVDPRRIGPIHHSLDLDDYRASPGDESDSARANRGGPLIISVGRLVTHKRIEDLIDAMSHLAADFPDARLDILGDGSARAALQARCDSLGLSDRVTFHGHVSRERVLATMRVADLLVLPSLEESLSHVAVEAIAIGVPVVATRIRGLDEVLTDETALLVPPCDSRQLAVAMRRMLTDRNLRETLVQNGTERARAVFSWEQNLPALESVLARAIGGREAIVAPLH